MIEWCLPPAPVEGSNPFSRSVNDYSVTTYENRNYPFQYPFHPKGNTIPLLSL